MGQIQTPPVAPAAINFANPTASITLAVQNGIAITAMRSDAAPALSQAIAPTWTGVHVFSPAVGPAITASPAAGSSIVATRNIQLTSDTQEIQLGAGSEYRLYHDGSNSYIRTDTGALLVQLNATVGPYFLLSGAVPAFFSRDGTAANPSISFDSSAGSGFFHIPSHRIGVSLNTTEAARFEFGGAEEMSMYMYDTTGATLKRVSRGAADSAGAGFRALRIPN